jgi:hypothetical protein
VRQFQIGNHMQDCRFNPCNDRLHLDYSWFG